MNFLKITTAIVFIGLLLGCTTKRVSYDYDPASDFASFKSYSWLEKDVPDKPDPRIANDLLDQRIKLAIDTTLQRKSYYRSTDGVADFLVAYQIGIEKRTEADRVSTGIGFGYRLWDVGIHSDTIVREYDQVTLYLDVIEPKTQKLIWRGVREYRYRTGGSVADKDARIRGIVGEILAGFPPLK